MKVKELIEILKTFPEDAGVFIKSDLYGIYPLDEVKDNDITEVDCKESIVLS